ncbi:hypothetical protein [Thermoproteus tenax]|uniref:Uncharacterized protein n=1 Tax=Thermoproteus tenax (strain ATCC 35583 / DSM 2078 / JCM 9277 / NBRC 100435 / Kra 1) TaxID=768679 RepID=G4RP25_THETK|nr:hypothetical protein [Thermoproteus tenax]CCC81319.1 hypothetical protein TTX_0659 [Thermoproteus tenax Kra 1]
MISAPPAVMLLPLPSKDQVVNTVSMVISKFKKIGVPVELKKVDGPIFIECRVSPDGTLQRLDVYLAVGGDDFATITPVQERIVGNFIERVAFVHIAQGVAVQINYEIKDSAALKNVIVYAVGPAYRDLVLR